MNIGQPAAKKSACTSADCTSPVSGISSPIYLAILVLITVALHLPMLGDWFNLTPDGIGYLRAARCLAETGSLPPERLTAPVGFVVVLAPLLWLGNTPWLAIRVLFLIFSTATILLAFLLAKKHLSARGAFLAAALVASSTVLLRLEATLLSETVFISLSLLTLLLMTRWDQTHMSQGGILGSGLAAALTATVRSIGFLLPLIGLWLFLRNSSIALRRRIILGLIFLLPTVAITSAWEFRQSRYPATKTYSADWFHARASESTTASGIRLYADRMFRLAPQRMAEIKACLLPPRIAWRLFQPPYDNPASLTIGFLVLSIAVTRACRRSAPIDLYLLGTFLILCFWPWNEGDRFMAPLIPILGIYVVTIIRTIANAARRWAPRTAMFAIPSILLLALQLGEWDLYRITRSAPQQRARATHLRMGRIAAWMARQIPPAATLEIITRQGSNEKTLLLSSAYLARRNISKLYDVLPDQDFELPAARSNFVLADPQALHPRRPEIPPVNEQMGFLLFGPSSNDAVRAEN